MRQMIPQIITLISWSVIILFTTIVSVGANDLADDIPLDEDKLEKFDALNRPGVNIQYIKRSAKASAQTHRSKGGDLAIGGFINKPGAKVGDVTIIFDGDDINAIKE